MTTLKRKPSIVRPFRKSVFAEVEKAGDTVYE